MSNKQKFQIEYSVKASPTMLYQYISTPSGLGGWFADDVKTSGNKFIFIWSGTQEVATLVARRADSLVRFRWEDDQADKYFFEIRIDQDELTGDVSLVISDFAQENEIADARQLWNNSISILKKLIGA